MNQPPIKQRADPPSAVLRRTGQLRSIPLEAVLRLCGAQPDRHDQHKWHTAVGTLSVNGAKFINWNCGSGGGGAIDLVIHLHHFHFRAALDWLERAFPNPPPRPSLAPAKPSLKMPAADPHKLWRVQAYLIHQRRLPDALLDPLIHSGLLYADARANAVFVLLGNKNNPVGAELRGTSDSRWRGMAPGSQKNRGFFSIPSSGPGLHPIAGMPADASACASHADRSAQAGSLPPRPIILCESAIDAISCHALHPDHCCISTSGARPNPRWLPAFLHHGFHIFCGFDADPTGESAAHAMLSLYPAIQRLRPTRHDWNDLLISQA